MNNYLCQDIFTRIMRIKPKVIREARFKKRYSQENLADFLGISQSQYSKLENAEVDFGTSIGGTIGYARHQSVRSHRVFWKATGIYQFTSIRVQYPE